MSNAVLNAEVSERALLMRINRKLAKDGASMRRCPEHWRGFNNLGRYYTVNVSRNVVIATHQDIESVGRELNAMEPFETVGKSPKENAMSNEDLDGMSTVNLLRELFRALPKHHIADIRREFAIERSRRAMN